MKNKVKRLKIVVVGLNFGRYIIEENLLKGPGSEYFELAGISALEPEQRDFFFKKYGVRAYDDLNAVLADPDIAVIGLFTGPSGRAKLIQKIVEAGKHVMTTKPLEIDPKAALAALKRAEEVHRVVYFNSPSPIISPDMRQILQWQNDLALGKAIAARADIWSNYREVPDGRWYDDPELCPVAPIFRLGIYLINDLVRIFGEPEGVFVMASRLFTERPTPDHAQLSIRFKSGALATVFASFCVNDAQWWLSSLTLNHENGTIYRNVGPAETKDLQRHPKMAVVINQNGKPFIQQAIAQGSNEDYPWEAFYNKIHGEKSETEMNPEEIVTGIRVVQAMARSQKSGSYERVIPINES